MAREYIPLPGEAIVNLRRDPLRLGDLRRAAGLAGFSLSDSGNALFQSDNTWGGLLRCGSGSVAAKGLPPTPDTPSPINPEANAIGKLYQRALYWDRVRVSLLDPSVCTYSHWNNLTVTPYVANGKEDGYLFGDFSDWKLRELDYGMLGANIAIERTLPGSLGLDEIPARGGNRGSTPVDLGISEETVEQTALAYWGALNVYGETLQEAVMTADLPAETHNILSARRQEKLFTDGDLWNILMQDLGLSHEKTKPVLEVIYREWKDEVLRQGFNSPFYQAVDRLVNCLWKAVDEAMVYNWDILTD